MNEPMALGELIPETMTQMREAAAKWEALTPAERDSMQAKWDEEARVERENELARWRMWDAVDTPPRYADAHVTNEQAMEWVERVCADPESRGLLIAGPTGVGKTFLLWGLVHELASHQGPRVEVVKLVRLLTKLRPGGSDEPDEVIRRLCQVPILAIDDIGAQKSSEWVNERLYEIIDTRYDNCKPIIATTNRKNLELSLDDRLVSRLMECCDQLLLTGADRRRAVL